MSLIIVVMVMQMAAAMLAVSGTPQCRLAFAVKPA